MCFDILLILGEKSADDVSEPSCLLARINVVHHSVNEYEERSITIGSVQFKPEGDACIGLHTALLGWTARTNDEARGRRTPTAVCVPFIKMEAGRRMWRGEELMG